MDLEAIDMSKKVPSVDPPVGEKKCAMRIVIHDAFGRPGSARMEDAEAKIL